MRQLEELCWATGVQQQLSCGCFFTDISCSLPQSELLGFVHNKLHKVLGVFIMMAEPLHTQCGAENLL